MAALVEAGLIFRRDSANGKRFCRRDEKGAMEDAFGFDLAPLALKAGEIFQAAETARAEGAEVPFLREAHADDQSPVSEAIITALDQADEAKARDTDGAKLVIESEALSASRGALEAMPSGSLARELAEESYKKKLAVHEARRAVEKAEADMAMKVKKTWRAAKKAGGP